MCNLQRNLRNFGTRWTGGVRQQLNRSFNRNRPSSRTVVAQTTSRIHSSSFLRTERDPRLSAADVIIVKTPVFELACGSLTLHLFRSIFILSLRCCSQFTCGCALDGWPRAKLWSRFEFDSNTLAAPSSGWNGSREWSALSQRFEWNFSIFQSPASELAQREKNDVKFGRIGN